MEEGVETLSKQNGITLYTRIHRNLKVKKMYMGKGG